MESWLGSREADLLMAWGPLTTVSSDGSGGKLIVYTEQRVYVSPGYANTTTTGSATGYGFGNTAQVYGQAQSVTTYTPPQINQWQVFRQFRVDSRGIITAYSSEARSCNHTPSLRVASFFLLFLSSERTQGNPKRITFILRESGFRGAAGLFQEQRFEVEQSKPYGGGNSNSTE